MNGNVAGVDEYLAGLPEWQADALSKFRELIHELSDEISEEIKWGVPAFIYKSKVLFTMAAFKSHVKYNFILNGAILEDPHGLFNNGLESAKSRGIDLTEGQESDKNRLSDLVQEAISKF